MQRRITFCATGMGGGGAETQLVRLARGLQDRGWAPNIVALIEHNDFEEELRAAKIPYQHLGIERGRPDPRAALRLYRALRQVRPDVLCTFLVAANTIGRIVGRMARVPAIVSSIRTPVLPNARREWMLRVSQPFDDAVVFNSQTVANDAVARGLVPSSDVHVIRNGLDVPGYDAYRANRDEVRASLGLAPDEFVWLVVGHLRAEKNYPALVEAFRRLRREYPNAKLVSAGGFFGEEERVLAAATEEIEDGSIQFLGLRRDVPNLLAAADAFVLASHYDASPNGLIEALASRLPAVATDVGGVPEIIPSPAEGILASTPSADSLFEAMGAMMALSDAERRSLGEAGRSHVERIYGRVRMIDEWESLFDHLLADR
jgi:glycosyltransferase involved in cell wall biosynthesis